MNLKRCYHKSITAHDAENLLMEKDVGSFLYRSSSTDRNGYSLSIRREGGVTHIKIQNHGSHFEFSGGGEQFPTLYDLIKCYYDKGGLSEKNGVFIRLISPVNCKYPTSERWFHGLMSGIEAQKLLLEKGKNGSFLVRESVNRLGEYVISIRSDDDVKQVKIRYSSEGKYDLVGDPAFLTIGKLMEYYAVNPLVEVDSSTILHLKQPFNSTTFIASGITDRINELSKKSTLFPEKDGFWEEFEQLKQPELRHTYSRKIGMLSENKDKNRFKNIVPFDDTRVKLQGCTNDYINASYIRSENGNSGDEYIATQGCLPETVADFLQMIYQENSRVILMVSPEVERGKEICAKYWPDSECTMNVKHFTIKTLNEVVTNDFIKREIELINTNDHINEKHILYQYQYLAWPETGQPSNIGSVLGVLDDINLLQKKLPESRPLIVHCSNGIGRTACVIVIDMLVKSIVRDGLECELDIQKIVQHIRTQRFDQMVQLESQYKLIYSAIAHHVEMDKALCCPSVEEKRSFTRNNSRPAPAPPKTHRPPPKPATITASDKNSIGVPNCSALRPLKPPTITINGTAPPPIPERKVRGDMSVSNIFSKPPNLEDLKLTDAPPPIPERKK